MGATTCDFCLMLASRGPVYGSSETAGGEGNKYHDHCYCIPVPVVGRWVVDSSTQRGYRWDGQSPGYGWINGRTESDSDMAPEQILELLKNFLMENHEPKGNNGA